MKMMNHMGPTIDARTEPQIPVAPLCEPKLPEHRARHRTVATATVGLNNADGAPTQGPGSHLAGPEWNSKLDEGLTVSSPDYRVQQSNAKNKT